MTGASSFSAAIAGTGPSNARSGVDLVGEEWKIVPVRKIDQRRSCLTGVRRPGRIVGIDDNERTRGRSDEAAHVVNVGLPAALLGSPIEDGFGVNLREDRCVQWIRWYRDQDLVARTGQCRQRELDALGRAGRDHHAIGRHRHAALNAFGRNCLAGLQDTDRRGVAVLAVAHRPLDRFDHVGRRAKPKNDWITNVQIADLAASRLELASLRNDISNRVAETAHALRDRDCGASTWHHLRILLPLGAFVIPSGEWPLRRRIL